MFSSWHKHEKKGKHRTFHRVLSKGVTLFLDLIWKVNSSKLELEQTGNRFVDVPGRSWFKRDLFVHAFMFHPDPCEENPTGLLQGMLFDP